MQEIFVAIIMTFDVQSGQLLEVGAAAFDNPATCAAVVERVKTKAAADMQVYVEASCIEAPLFTAAE